MPQQDTKTKLLRTYLLVTFFYGLLGFLDAVFFSRGAVGNINTYHYLATLVFFTFLLFSIVALVYFVQDNLPRITWVLPTYTIVTKVGIVVAAFVWASSLANAQVAVVSQAVPTLLVSLAILFSLFECGFSVYLLRRFGMV